MAKKSEKPKKGVCNCCGFFDPIGGVRRVSPNSQSKRFPNGMEICSICGAAAIFVAVDYGLPGSSDKALLCNIANSVAAIICDRLKTNKKSG